MKKIVEPKYNGGPLVEANYVTYGSENVKVSVRKRLANSYMNDVELPDLEAIDVEPGYLSDRFDNSWMKENLCNNKDSFFVKAPTGSGKTYWVIHFLRVFAMMLGLEVLYLCNRKMLKRQIVNEAIAAVDPTRKGNYSGNRDYYEIGNLTLMSYQHFYIQCEKNSIRANRFFGRYRICVLDEVHFFFSDAMFNPYTGKTLEYIVNMLRNCVRIYMSATPEPVITPILYAEALRGLTSYNEKHHIRPKKIFWMKEDENKYRNIRFFSSSKDDDPISKMIIKSFERNQKGKWIVFVSSKEVGKELFRKLKMEKINPAYIDGDSRNADPKSRYMYEVISEGNLSEFDVLITTPVLDNGFSIHDPNVKNVVIYSDNRTEFLQELGRIRLAKGQDINIYTPFMDCKGFLNNNTYSTVMDAMLIFLGSKKLKEYDKNGTDVTPDSKRALEYLKSVGRYDAYNGVFYTKKIYQDDDNTPLLKPEFNEMVRWYMRVVKAERCEFDELCASCDNDRRTASVSYKIRWISNNPNIIIQNWKDYVLSNDTTEIISLFTEYIDKPMLRPSGGEEEYTTEERCYVEFESFFRKRYHKVFPDRTNVNPHSTRKAMKPDTLRKHIDELFENCSEYLKLKKEGDYYYLRKEGCSNNVAEVNSAR